MGNGLVSTLSENALITTLGIIVGLPSIIIIYQAAYNLVFHPLSKIPGPRWSAVSSIPYLLATFAGNQPFYLHDLHEKYGDVVRIAPDSLSFSDPDAAKELYVERPGATELRKDPQVYTVSLNGAYSILNVPNHADHIRYRRLLNPGFSDRAIRDQESVVKLYVDLLMQRLRENANRGSQDMVAWFNWTTFDIIGDLTFNQPFGCLEKSAYHPWITAVFQVVKSAVVMSGLARYPLVKHFLVLLFRERIQAALINSTEFTKAMVDHRVSSNVERIDFLSYALQQKSDKEFMTREEIEATSTILIIGGSETSATLLSAATYYLLTNPHVLQKLVAEIRGEFQKEEEINMLTVNQLPYLQAVIKEALRIFPPVTLGSPRIVEGNGKAISGIMVPSGTNVVANFYATSRSSRNFVDQDKFLPERWFDGDERDPRFETDKRSASIPFSLGRRDCIGKNLAHAEIRLILVRFLFNFDLELDDKSKNWAHKLKVYSLWEKTPLLVKLKPVA